MFADFYNKKEKLWDIELALKSHIYVGPSGGPYLFRGEIGPVHVQQMFILRRSHTHLPDRWRS